MAAIIDSPDCSGAHTDPATRTDDPITTILSAITRLRARQQLTDTQIHTIVNGYTAGIIPDYQMAAWLATCAAVGLSLPETIALTKAYAASGSTLTFDDKIRPIVDKHSTGGIGDKTTIVVAPIVAACGVSLCKMTGRGLGITGGTVDKLESISGMCMQLSATQLHDQLMNIGIAVTGQSDDLAPADRATYALRDVTATVDSLPLIAASVMGKKIASSADHVVLDVKFGTGALMPDRDSARQLAQLMLAIGTACNLSTTIALSDMNTPLGKAIGNALEVREAVDMLRNESSTDQRYLTFCLSLAAMLISGAQQCAQEVAYQRAEEALTSGLAYEYFCRWITAQQGDPAEILSPHWQKAPYTYVITSPRGGRITAIDARILGQLSLTLGAGRKTKSAPIDHRVGLWLACSIGDYLHPQDELIYVHTNKPWDMNELSEIILPAFTFTNDGDGSDTFNTYDEATRSHTTQSIIANPIIANPIIANPIIVESLSNNGAR